MRGSPRRWELWQAAAAGRDPSAAGELRPQHGDIIVFEQTRSRPCYTLSVLPGPPQVMLPVRAEAVQKAREYGQRRQTDCWFTRDGKTFELFGRHRVPP